MGQATDQIEAHIEETRNDLGSNLRELEGKVKSVTDWKQHFQDRPMTILTVAFGGGVLLAAMLGGRRKDRGKRRYSSSGLEASYAADSRPRNQAKETWDHIKGAMIGVAATRLTDFVDGVVPGFSKQLTSTRENKKASDSTVM